MQRWFFRAGSVHGYKVPTHTKAGDQVDADTGCFEYREKDFAEGENALIGRSWLEAELGGVHGRREFTRKGTKELF
ncbi:MAG: hypothetical protein ABSG32_04775 [Terriglobia bacterium]|jgi:hypothetical protein